MIPFHIDLPVPPWALTSPPAIVHYAEPPWNELTRRLVFTPAIQQPPLPPSPESEPSAPSTQQGVDLILAEEGTDLQGRWYQRFELVIKPGGTLADAAKALYDDDRRAYDLLHIVRQRHPGIEPHRIPVGLKIGVTVDPTVTFVLKESRREGDWEIRTYYNGAVERRRANARVVQLPTDRPGKEFAVPNDTSDHPLPAGARLLEYQYRAGETFEQAVAIVYGEPTVKAMGHFIAETGFDVDSWPPAAVERLRAVVPVGLSLTDEPIVSLEVTARWPEAEGPLRLQDEQRRQAGVFPVKRDNYGTTYHLRIADAKVSARQVAALLYNDVELWPDLARAAGIKLPKDDPPTDVRLQGREFDLYVEYDEEWFLLGEPIVDRAKGIRYTRLLNGTEIVAAIGGPNRVITLPSGHRKVVYQPIELTLFLARLVSHLFNEGEEGAARLLWDWEPGVPRQSGDVVRSAALVTQKQQTLLKVTVETRRSVADPVALIREWGPCALVVGAVFLGTILVLVVGRASAPKPYRRRR